MLVIQNVLCDVTWSFRAVNRQLVRLSFRSFWTPKNEYSWNRKPLENPYLRFEVQELHLASSETHHPFIKVPGILPLVCSPVLLGLVFWILPQPPSFLVAITAVYNINCTKQSDWSSKIVVLGTKIFSLYVWRRRLQFHRVGALFLKFVHL